MALTVVNNAIAKLVVETRLDVVDKVKAYLKDKLEMEESDLTELIDGFKETLDLTAKTATKSKKGKKDDSSDGEEKIKKKRAAGPYNIFLGEQIKQFKIDNPESKESKKFMSMAQDAWKALKEKYPDHAKESAKLYELWKNDNKK
jgi:hypothetical protein